MRLEIDKSVYSYKHTNFKASIHSGFYTVWYLLSCYGLYMLDKAIKMMWERTMLSNKTCCTLSSFPHFLLTALQYIQFLFSRKLTSQLPTPHYTTTTIPTRRNQLHEFNDSHRSTIAPSFSLLPDYPAIATIPGSIPFLGRQEQLLNQCLIVYVSQCLSSGVQGSSFGKSDHVVHTLTHSLRPSYGGANSSVSDNFSG